MNKGTKRAEYHKYADEAVRSRALIEGLARLRSGLFWGALGPLAIGIMQVLKYTPSRYVAIAVLATIPISLFQLVVNYIRLPAPAKLSGQALGVIFLTLAAAGATFVLALTFSITTIAKGS
jgi:hypothetical protein